MNRGGGFYSKKWCAHTHTWTSSYVCFLREENILRLDFSPVTSSSFLPGAPTSLCEILFPHRSLILIRFFHSTLFLLKFLLGKPLSVETFSGFSQSRTGNIIFLERPVPTQSRNYSKKTSFVFLLHFRLFQFSHSRYHFDQI